MQDFIAVTALPIGLRAQTAAPAFRSGSQFRVPVDEVLPRPQTNSDLTADDIGIATVEQYPLFSSYQRKRHEGGEMSGMDFSAYRAMIEDTPVSSRTVD